MARPAAAAAAHEEEILEVRCAGCGDTLEVERGLTEFICPDCSTAQALPPELMPPPPPRRRRALPIPPRYPATAAAAPTRLPCGVCGALLSVPPGLARCGCPVCGAELAVDAARLRQYLLSTAAAPLVPVSLPPVFQAREVRQEYLDSAVRVGRIRGDHNNRLVHVERSQVGQALLEYSDPDIDRDEVEDEMLNGINTMHSQRSGFSVGTRTVGAKRRQVEALNHVTYQAHAQQSIHAEDPDHAIHAEEIQNGSLNHAIHRDVGHIELIDGTVVRCSNRITGCSVDPKTVSVEKRQVQTVNQITRQAQKQPSHNIICAEHAALPYPDQVIDVQEAQIEPANHRCNAHVQLNNKITASNSNRRTGCSVSHRAVSANERQAEVANRVTKNVPKQHFDNMVRAECALADCSDQVIHVEEAELEPIHHASYRGEECLQRTNGTVAKHSKQQSGHLIGPKNINVKKRYAERLKQVIQEAEEQPSHYVFHTTQMHVEPQNDGVVWHGNKKIGTGAEPCSSRNGQEWIMPAEQLIYEEQAQRPPVDETHTEHIGADTRKQAPVRTQKRKKKGLMMASNEGLQLRRSKRLANESAAVIDSEPLQFELSEQQAASPYQNLSDLPDIDGVVANLFPGSSPRHEMPQLRSTESENLQLATSPALSPYLESHNEIIIEHGRQKSRAEVEPHLFYKGQEQVMPPEQFIPIQQEQEPLNDKIQTEQDEVEMGKNSVSLTHKSTKRALMSSSNEGFEHRRSKRIAKQSTAIRYCESAECESTEHQSASPSQSMSDSPAIDQVSDDISSSSLPQQDMPQRSFNEADNLHVTTQSASSIPDMSDPERFARYYSKLYPPEVRRALQRSPNLWLECLINQGPASNLYAGSKEIKRCGRGPTLCLKVWTMPEGVRIPVSLNDLGQPIGNEAATLSSFLGTLARDGTLAPLTYANWKRFPEKNKDVMWHIVNLKFVIAPIGEVWAMKALAKKWKDWKAVLKRERYDAHETEEERLADRDSRVPEEQWQLLVAHWGTEKAKAASARSRASQAQQPLGRHRTGSKSFARIREEERQKRPNREEPTRTDIFILTHTPKDGKGKPLDKATADVISHLHEEAQKQQNGSGSDSMEDVFAKVVGPDKRDIKRTYGLVPCTSELRGKTAAKVSLRQAMEAKRKAEDEAATLRKKIMEMEESQRKLQEDLTNLNSPASSGVNRRLSTDDLQN